MDQADVLKAIGADADRNVAGQSADSPVMSAGIALSKLAGRPVSPLQLRHHMGERNDLESLGRSLKAIGLPASISRARKLQAIAPRHFPCLLEQQDGKASVLLRFITRTRVQIWNPESRMAEVVECDELAKSFTGRFLVVGGAGEAGNRFELAASASRRGWFWQTLRSFWPVYGHVIIVSFLINCFALSIPLFVMNVYDRVVPNQAIASLWALAIGVILALSFDFLFRNLRSYFIDHAGRTADSVIGSRLMGQLLSLRLKERLGQVGTFANSLREYENIREFFSSSTISVLVDLPFVLLFILVIYLISGPLAFVPLAALPLVLLFSLLLRIPMRRLTERNLQDAGTQHGVIVEVTAGLETIKSSGAESLFMDRWDRAIERSSETSRQLRFYYTVSTAFTQFSVQMATVVIIVWGVYLIKDNQVSVGALVAATILTGRSLAPLGMMSNMLLRLQQSLSSLKRLNAFMKLEFEDYGAGRLSSILEEGGLDMRQVVFSYPDAKRQALNGVSCRIRPGEKVAILGRIGSGKSTVARMMVGLYDPEEGSISLNGIDLAQYNPSDLRRYVGYVGQENFLFSGSIRENIGIGAPLADEEAIHRAADVSGVSEFVRQFPDGYETPVGERGASLSGGQRQTIALARALVLDPSILILDEPTSQMDQGSEARLRERLTEYTKDKTLIIITHRTSLLSLVDRLIVIDAGRIVADGPKEKVLQDLNQGKVKAAE
ncbi:type I secretion system permease/ATPase [Limibacillus sp. MBR-115]|jgi:ATP-binding cassette subfamily C protein LapB|uniref:type I secretion system permease/ATPase n=1 Tax=Limibacillus sp. MBR-115 TaxID=3156465 RepID=UPI003399DA56